MKKVRIFLCALLLAVTALFGSAGASLVPEEPLYYDAVFCAQYGGVLLVSFPEDTSVHTIIPEEPVVIRVREGAVLEVTAEPWEFYCFDGWDTQDFSLPDLSDPGTQRLIMPSHDTWLRAGFTAGPYAFDPSRGVILPDGLTVIGEEAFAGVPIRFFFVQSGVKSIGRRAFPKDAVVYLDVSSVEDLPLDAIDTSGAYIDYGVVPNTVFAYAALGSPYIVMDIYANPVVPAEEGD